MVSPGSVYQRQDGYWVAALRLGSKRLVRYAKSEPQAKRALAQLQRELGLGKLSVPGKHTLESWGREWLETKELRPSSRGAYQRALAAWWEPLGHLRLHKLSSNQLQAVLLSWKQQGLGARTREQRWVYLHGCLESAVELGLLSQNPLKRVPKPVSRPSKGSWTLPEAQAFLATAQVSRIPYADLLAFLLLTGMRLSEALALEPWDLQAGAIEVSKAIVWVDGAWSLQPPKTLAGRRLVPLPQRAEEILKNRVPDPRFFQTRTGTPPRKDNLSRIMTRLCAEAGVPRIEVRELRRVHAALLVRGGLDIKSLQAHLGHARASTSLDIYAFQVGEDRSLQALTRGLGLGS